MGIKEINCKKYQQKLPSSIVATRLDDCRGSRVVRKEGWYTSYRPSVWTSGRRRTLVHRVHRLPYTGELFRRQLHKTIKRRRSNTEERLKFSFSKKARRLPPIAAVTDDHYFRGQSLRGARRACLGSVVTRPGCIMAKNR